MQKVTCGTASEEWTTKVTGEEDASYVAETTYSKAPERTSGTQPLKLGEYKQWYGKATLDQAKYTLVTDLTALGLAITATLTLTYTGDHGMPAFAVGKTWAFSEKQTLDPPLQGPKTTEKTVEVAGKESVTVPAGTFECYKVVTKNKSTGAVMKTQYWSVGNEFIVPVKSVDEAAYTAPEIRELKSYTP